MMEEKVLNVLRGTEHFEDAVFLANGDPFVDCPHIGSGRIAVCRYAEAKSILSDNTNFSSAGVATDMISFMASLIGDEAENVSNWMIYAETQEKKDLKKYMQDSMSRIQKDVLKDFVRYQSNEVVQKITDKNQIDVIEDLALPLPLETMCVLLGLPLKDKGFLKQNTQDLLLITEPEITPIMRKKVQAAWKNLSDYFGQILESEPQDGILHYIAKYNADTPYKKVEQIHQCISLLLGAHETTIGLLANTFYLLLKNKEQIEHVSGDVMRNMPIIDEVMRFDPPSKITARHAIANLSLSGRPIKQGDKFIIVFKPCNLDPLFIDKGNVFNCSRSQRTAYLSFGYGEHFCLGSQLAKFQAACILTAFAKQFNLMSYDVRDVEWLDSDVFRRISNLKICTKEVSK